MPSPMNAWSLLYEELKMTDDYAKSDYYYDTDRNKDFMNWTLDDRITLGIATASEADYTKFWEEDGIEIGSPTKQSKYKYSEEEILKELSDYIAGTYNQHYSAGDDKIQTLDLIEACGDGEAFCRSNILKYASRYDKKGTARRDIMKILHYAVLLLHFNDKNAKREIYPQ